MSFFNTSSSKEILQLRNKVFLTRGIPILEKEGFRKSPFSTAHYGWHPGIGYLYELCRLSDNCFLEVVSIHIIRGDRWIQIRLNIFELAPQPASLEQLKGLEGLKFNLPPNSTTNMRLHSDDIKGIPLFNYNFMADHHRLKRYFTNAGRKRRAAQLGDRIEKDLNNINCLVQRWHELHKPKVTNWEGEKN